jgi:hypothetical protein
MPPPPREPLLPLSVRIEETRKKLQTLQARRVSSFVAWYKEKFSWLFALPTVPFLFVSFFLWYLYGILWIPAWFLISLLVRDKSLDESLDAAIDKAQETLRSLERQRLRRLHD